ncbi:MAG: Bax inhibitor-1 family protein [Pyrinomonadaceae bacterium]|nr:Bax inhibitor-1 family protein [Pyrinomonadaceae bacterium]
MNAPQTSNYYPKKRWKHFRNRIKKDEISPSIISVSESTSEEKAVFICNTYLHLATAIGWFIALEVFLLKFGVAQMVIDGFIAVGRGFIFVFLALIILLWLFFSFVKLLIESESSKEQYIGFGMRVFVSSFIFAPLLSLYEKNYGIELILEAGIITIGLSLGITAVAFLTHKDFSFLLPILVISCFLTIGFFITGIIFRFSIQNVVALILVALAAGWMLYETSKVLHRYQINQHVAASIALFSSIEFLFLAILRSYRTSSSIQNYKNDSNAQ